MSKQKILLFTCLSIFFLPLSQAQDSLGKVLNIQRSIEIALKNNLTVEQSQSQMELNGVNLKQAKDYKLPFLNAYASQGVNFGRSINPYTNQYIDQQINTGNYYLNSSFTLFNGLQLQNGVKQNAYAFQASQMDWQQQKDNITLTVILAYLQVLGNEDVLKTSRELADVDAKQVERLEIENKDGAIAPSTLFDLKGAYANDLVNISQSVNNLEAAKLNLFQLLNVPYKKDIQFERLPLDAAGGDIQAGSDSIFQTALVTLPMIKSVDLRIKSYQKALAVAKGQYYPNLSLYGSVSTNYSSAAEIAVPGTTVDQVTSSYVTIAGTNSPVYSPTEVGGYNKAIGFGDQFKNNRYTQLGIQISIPIINYFKARNSVKTARINLKNSENISVATRNQLQQSVELAYQNMIMARDQLKSYGDQVDAYQQSFHAAEIKFNDGVITSVDYVIAKNNLDKAIISQMQARYNYIFRGKILDYYQGKLSW